MEDPDHGWQPKNRPQSTIARSFMSELDNLFDVDRDLDTIALESTVVQKKKAVTTAAQELQALEARLRAAEERLHQAKGTSPPSRKDSQGRTPVEGTFSEEESQASGSPLAEKSPPTARNMAARPPVPQRPAPEKP